MKKVLKNNLLMLRYIARFCPSQIVFTILSSILSSGISVMNILLNRYIISSLTESTEFRGILILILAFLGVNLIYAVLSGWIANVTQEKNMQILSQRMQLEIFDKTKFLDLECYEDSEFFNKFTFALRQSERRAIDVLNTFSTFIGSLFGIASLAALVTTLEPVILIFVGVNVIISFIVNLRASKTRHAFFEARMSTQREAEYSRRVFYNRDYAKELRLFFRFPAVIKTKFNDATDRLVDIIRRFGKKLWGYNTVQSMSGQFLNAGTMLLIAWRVFYKVLSVADFVALTQSSSQLASQITQMLGVFPQLYEHSIYIDNFVDFLNYDSKIETSGGDIPAEGKMGITLQNVSFSYPGTRRVVLSDVTIDIKPGEKVAFVGRNGAGKSTLIKLITRLYEPTDGKMLLDGTAFSEYDITSLRNNVGIIFQDFQAFAVTIAENILMRPMMDKERDTAVVEEALRYVDMYDKVMGLDDGINTVITREFNRYGAIFSGGELQKIAIARIYAQESSIIILDEPSSALDPIAESEIFNTVLGRSQDKTVILISHRLSNVKGVDRIFFIDNGCLAEQGSHRELMDLGGLYSEMYRTQSEKYFDTEEDLMDFGVMRGAPRGGRGSRRGIGGDDFDSEDGDEFDNMR